MDYKKKIIELFENNTMDNETINNLSKDFYKTVIDYIKKNEITIKSHIEKQFNNMQIYFVSSKKIFLWFYYDNTCCYKILNEDELICEISKNIDTNIFNSNIKHSIIDTIIYNIKQEELYDFIPESKTIKKVVEIFQTIINDNKDYCKFLLIIIGEIMTKTKTESTYIVSNDIKKIMIDIHDFAFSYFKINTSFIENFKTKNNNYNLNKCIILTCNKYKTIYSEIIKNNIIPIIMVSIYYKKRYESSNKFLDNHINNNFKKSILFFKDMTIDSILSLFEKSYLEESNVLTITHKEIHYLWKEFCSNKNIPNIVSYTQLTNYFGNNLHKTSSKLEYVSEFINFWSNNITIDNEETMFEISELQYLIKITIGVVINESKIINLINHFYNLIEIENNKYIHKINCKILNKREILLQFKKSNLYDDSLTINKLYKRYIEWNNGKKIVIGKSYFSKYI